MPEHNPWFLFLGTLLLASAVLRVYLKELPLTSSLTYFVLGMAIGPNGLRLLNMDVSRHEVWLEHITEIAVVISLFTAGLKLHTKVTGRLWPNSIRLATIGMVVSVGLIAALGHTLLGLSLGAAVLLGAILSPTDPVLASDVQVSEVHDRDRLRFTLTGEACLNDGTAFPFVMLGLGLLGLHKLGAYGWEWWLIDVLWATAMGLVVGFGLGYLVGKMVVYVHRTANIKIEADEFLALGLIALSYGVAIEIKAYGFLAVFAAGFALRNFEEKVSRDAPDRVLSFNEQLERLFEIGVVLLFGSLFDPSYITWNNLLLAAGLLLIVRPLSTLTSLIPGSSLNRVQLGYISWFGVRGVGSVYYYAYAANKGLDPSSSKSLMGALYTVILVSLIMHGFSVTPLMNRYKKAFPG